MQLYNKSSTYILSAVLFILSLITIIPFLLMVSTSLKSPSEINSPVFHWIPESFRFENYVNALNTGNWGLYLFNSAYVTIVVTLVSLLLNSLAGFAFARLDFKFNKFLFLSVMIGLMIPPQITMIPVFIIMKNMPFAGGNDWLGQGGTGWVDSYAGLMVTHMAGAFGIFLSRQYYLNFPKALDEAAELDGCSIWKTYFKIYAPLSAPLFGSLGVIKLTSTWNDYVWPLIITNSENMRTVQLALTIFKNEAVQWELLMAATTVITLPLVLVYLFAQNLFVKGFISSSVKG